MIEREKREAAFNAARQNLTCALTLSDDVAPESLMWAFQTLQRSRLVAPGSKAGRQRLGHVQLTVPDATRRYLQGKLLLRLGKPGEARPFLESARIHLMALGSHPRDVFAVTLDLAESYLLALRHPWRKVTGLLAGTLALCPVEDIGPEAQAALDLFQAALESRDLDSATQQVASARRRYFLGQ
jgi:hypothetical protein